MEQVAFVYGSLWKQRYFTKMATTISLFPHSGIANHAWSRYLVPQTADWGPRTATLAEHTHHKEGSPGSDCLACHMPQIATEGVPGTFVRSHTFRFIPPSLTTKYKIPNPCTSCHAGKSPDWAEAAFHCWSERSPWRLN